MTLDVSMIRFIRLMICYHDLIVRLIMNFLEMERWKHLFFVLNLFIFNYQSNGFVL